ncbi:HVA1 family protein [Porphyrobacter algicida]|uniref:HVA1 family protein n=1 Tax=Qipengyuania algicida TaxID=1836209 RepID=A0A845AGP9_9SPHN|nr:DUF2945 domain-containing protein [Qipengyuania algicida]MXP29772.1 HVA1 family protein [Qipengyuania algicida]
MGNSSASDANSFRSGQYVTWKWGNGKACGKISDRFERDVTRTLDGSEITRHGDQGNPAYLIRQDEGSEVLKLGSELAASNR